MEPLDARGLRARLRARAVRARQGRPVGEVMLSLAFCWRCEQSIVARTRLRYCGAQPPRAMIRAVLLIPCLSMVCGLVPLLRWRARPGNADFPDRIRVSINDRSRRAAEWPPHPHGADATRAFGEHRRLAGARLPARTAGAERHRPLRRAHALQGDGDAQRRGHRPGDRLDRRADGRVHRQGIRQLLHQGARRAPAAGRRGARPTS